VELALAHPGGNGDDVERLETISPRRVNEDARLRRRERDPLAPRCAGAE
jgi:hypothetical protein